MEASKIMMNEIGTKKLPSKYSSHIIVIKLMWLTCLEHCSVIARIPWGLVENVVRWVGFHVWCSRFTVAIRWVLWDTTVVHPCQYETVRVFVCLPCGVNGTFQVLPSLTGIKHTFHSFFCLELFWVCLLSTRQGKQSGFPDRLQFRKERVVCYRRGGEFSLRRHCLCCSILSHFIPKSPLKIEKVAYVS